MHNINKNFNCIASMFDNIANKYDFMNILISFGQIFIWRKRIAKLINAKKNQIILDLATGTGSSSILINKKAKIFACDISKKMLNIGKKKNIKNVKFIFCNAENLPFKNNFFDKVTISFGLRNMEKPLKVLKEMKRVLRPNGSIILAEFSVPKSKILKFFYFHYLKYIVPVIAKLVIKNKETKAYTYLFHSIKTWPLRSEINKWLKKVGFKKILNTYCSKGILVIFRGKK